MWLMTVTVFLIFFVGPGSAFVARVLAGRQATPVQVAAVSHRLWLDRPIWDQYLHWVGVSRLFGASSDSGLLQGNLGHDYYHSESVNTVLKAALPITLSLVFGAAILWLAMGLASGIVSAVKTRSIWDRTFTTLALTFYSMPTFVLGLLLILGLYYETTIHHMNIFPAPGTWVSLTSNPIKWAQGLILPWLTLALVSAATYTRLTRGSMLDVFGEDYIRTARSKGMSERRLILRHNLRASLTPIVTQFGLDVGVLLGGAIITETVFSLPGLGWTAIKAIQSQDLPLVMGITIVASVAVVVLNMAADIMYAVLDPRVRIH